MSKKQMDISKEIRRLGEDLTDQSGELRQAAQEKAEMALEQVNHRSSELKKSARDKAEKVLERVERIVQANRRPIMTAGAAIGTAAIATVAARRVLANRHSNGRLSIEMDIEPPYSGALS